jgi:ankyrin repeat protein
MHVRYVSLLALISAVGLSAAGPGPNLVDAVKSGNRDMVHALVRQRADVNAKEQDGTTALHWAVRADDQETADLLIKSGANVNAANQLGITPLVVAATNANAALVSDLLRAGADVTRAGADGETVLMTGARSGNPDVVRALAKAGTNVNSVERWQGQTALMWAAAENHGAAVKALLELGADANIRSKELAFPDYRYETNGMAVFQLPKGGWTALMYAARENAIDAVAAMADAHVDLNARSATEGTTALQLAVINAHYDLARLLLDKGADPNVVDSSGMSALYAAVDMRAPANMLTRPEPKPHDQLDAVGAIKVLLAHKADPNMRLKKPIIGRHQNLVGDAALTEGATALARAAKGADVAVIRLLLDGGADATLTLKDRTTTTMLAAAAAPEPKALEAVQLLVEHGVDVNAFNANGQTILHNAAGRGSSSILLYAAQHGAKLDRRDKQNRTALDIAMGVGGGRRGGAGRGRGAEPNEKVAALLRDLMSQQGLPVPPAPQPTRTTAAPAAAGGAR